MRKKPHNLTAVNLPSPFPIRPGRKHHRTAKNRHNSEIIRHHPNHPSRFAPPAGGGSGPKEVGRHVAAVHRQRKTGESKVLTCCVVDPFAVGTPGSAAAPAAGTRDKGAPRGPPFIIIIIVPRQLFLFPQ